VRKGATVIAVVKQLIVRAGADFSGMNAGMKKANRDMKNFQSGMSSSLKKMAGAFAAAFAVKKIVDFGKASYEASNQMAVNEAKLATVMRSRMGATDDAIRSVKDLINAQEGIGVVDVVAQTSAAQELATYLDSAAGLKAIMPTLNDLIAQQYGMSASAEQATSMATMLGKVLDGQTGALKRYGFTFSKAEEKMLKYGSEAQRVSLLAEIVEGSIGKMNEELGKTPQGQMKQLRYTFDSIKMEIGRGILPILQALLPTIRAVANAFLTAAQYARAFVSAIFGSSKASTDATSNQVAAVGGLSDAYEDAGKSAKKAASSVAGFDEVNTLGSGGSGADNSAGMADFAPSLGDTSGLLSGVSDSMTSVADKAKEMAERVKTAFGEMRDFIVNNKDIIISALAGIGTAFSLVFIANNWAGIISGIRTALSGLGAVFGLILSPIGLIVIAIAALVAAFVYFYRTNEGFRGVVDGILQKIGDVAKWLWTDVLVPLGRFLGDVFVAAWNALKVAAEWVWKNVLVPMGSFLTTFYKTVITPLAAILKDVLAVAFEIVSKIAKSFWENVLVPLGKALKEMFGPAVEAISAVLTFLWEKVFVPLGKFLSGTMLPIWQDAVKVIEYLWKSVLKPLATYLGEVFLGVFDNVFKTIGGIINGIKEIFIGLMNFITGVFTGDWEKAWEGVKKIFKGVFDSLWSIVKFPLNQIIDGINSVISGLNSLSIDLPDWMGGQSFGVNIPKIPRLARGGIVDGATNFGNFVAGEAGAEMVVPLENTSFTDKIAAALGTAVMNAMQMGQSDNNKGDTVIQIDGVTIARAIQQYTAKENNRIGGSLIKST